MNYFVNKLNIAVIKGLRSITKRVHYYAKIEITKEQYSF
jgi:hypothetical protein